MAEREGTTVKIETETHRRLKAHVDRRGLKLGHLITKLVDEYLKREDDARWQKAGAKARKARRDGR